MRQQCRETIDVLICAGLSDVHSLLKYCVASCIKNFPPLGSIYIVTPDRKVVENILVNFKCKIVVIEDDEFLDEIYYCSSGWYKQQLVRLHADKICSTDNIACLSADTILLSKIEYNDVIYNNKNILYHNPPLLSSKHTRYEYDRLINIEKILKIKAVKSRVYIDFILDFNLFNKFILISLREYLYDLYGENYFKCIEKGKYETLEEKKQFGEWTLYAVFLLDVIEFPTIVRRTTNHYITQVHSNNNLENYAFDSKIVHFVSKKFNFDKVRERLDILGVII